MVLSELALRHVMAEGTECDVLFACRQDEETDDALQGQFYDDLYL